MRRHAVARCAAQCLTRCLGVHVVQPQPVPPSVHGDFAALDAAERRLARAYECKICFAHPIESVFLPCGHAMCCTSCAASRGTCPVCVLKVETVTHLTLQ